MMLRRPLVIPSYSSPPALSRRSYFSQALPRRSGSRQQGSSRRVRETNLPTFLMWERAGTVDYGTAASYMERERAGSPTGPFSSSPRVGSSSKVQPACYTFNHRLVSPPAYTRASSLATNALVAPLDHLAPTPSDRPPRADGPGTPDQSRRRSLPATTSFSRRGDHGASA
jgi:hypothetical protein